MLIDLYLYKCYNADNIKKGVKIMDEFKITNKEMEIIKAYRQQDDNIKLAIDRLCINVTNTEALPSSEVDTEKSINKSRSVTLDNDIRINEAIEKQKNLTFVIDNMFNEYQDCSNTKDVAAMRVFFQFAERYISILCDYSNMLEKELEIINKNNLVILSELKENLQLN